MSPFPLSLSWHLLTVQKAIMALDPLPARTCTPGTPPQAGRGAAPEVNWSTPCLLPRPAAGPRWGGAGVHLPLGMSFLLWVKEDPPFG